ncbi:hypothetical protein NFI96_016608 [Prochilodus magdalenae]|nr:hypothetical protein NFI96_016608 [Prochilodus magdalenae]
MNLTIRSYPCKVHLHESPGNRLKENSTVNLRCSTSKQCPHHPEWHGFSSGTISNFTTEDKAQEKVSELRLNLTWRDDGRTLSCRPVGSTDACQVRNITLEVEYAPKETKTTVGSEDVRETQTVTLHCSSKARPNPSFIWLKDDQIISQSAEDYILDNVKPENGGKYHCRASNVYGTEDSNTVIINVKYAPKGVEVRAEPVDVKKGDELRLTCLVQKSNPEVYQSSYMWYKDQQELSQYKGKKELNIQSISQSNNGRYHCRVTNTIGSSSSKGLEISVKYAPENTLIHGSSEVKLGSDLILNCSADAYPHANSYSWYYKSEDMQQYVVHLHPTQVYWITKVAIDNSGWYMCCPRNVIGTGLNSSEFRVNVLYPPQQLTLTMADVVKETEMLHIICTVQSYPMAVITLSRTSLTNPKAEVHVMSITHNSNKLMFSGNVSESNAGVYTCTAQNSEGRAHKKHQLKVLYAPKDVQVNGIQELREGKDLTLTCRAHSEPMVSMYSWMKSSGTDTKTIGQGQALTLRSVNASNAGNYFCTASNEIGTNKSAEVQFRVQHRPYITIFHNLTSLAQWDGITPVLLICSIDSYPAVKYHIWYKQNGNIEEEMGNHQNYTVETPGIYYCRAENEIQKSTSEVIELLVNVSGFSNQMLQILIPVFILCILIGIIIVLVHRLFMRKRSPDGTVIQSRFFPVIPARSSTVSDLFLLGTLNNTRENLAIEETTEPYFHSNNQSATPAHSNSSDRDNPARRPVSKLNTVYDTAKCPQTMQDRKFHKQEDSTTSSGNYGNWQTKDNNNPTKNIRSNDGGGVIYAVVLKHKQNTKMVQDPNEDYENMSGAYAPRPDFSNIIWDSSSSEEEEELNYARVTVIGTPQRKPQPTADDSSSDEEARTDYSQVKF